jgi:hypothetical protein
MASQGYRRVGGALQAMGGTVPLMLVLRFKVFHRSLNERAVLLTLTNGLDCSEEGLTTQ